ncbi:collectin-10 isoform X2 [Python bivittatus]|uniref:Collectin-10 isoform X2 n=1 Tax=Python bivittatus TaxID=176946 RepID=A0A9F5IFP4_PYTBI|nr:collectin-10 isoform X2 [Python bivittatus]
MEKQRWKHETFLVLFLVLVQIFGLEDGNRQTAEICSTHTILPGPKGDEGEKGDQGEMGRSGKLGPTGSKGNKGAIGDIGEQGMIGKIGPIGRKGAVCDCGKYRKVVGQLDINVARLKSSITFVKNVLAGIRETEEKYYYIVQEEKNYKEALTHCRIREGILAMPKDEAANAVISDYVSQSGLFRVFIGVNDIEKEGQFMYADRTPLQSYSNWKEGEPQDTYENEDCVEMLSTGKWNDTECHLTMYFVCEFPKRRK